MAGRAIPQNASAGKETILADKSTARGTIPRAVDLFMLCSLFYGASGGSLVGMAVRVEGVVLAGDGQLLADGHVALRLEVVPVAAHLEPLAVVHAAELGGIGRLKEARSVENEPQKDVRNVSNTSSAAMSLSVVAERVAERVAIRSRN